MEAEGGWLMSFSTGAVAWSSSVVTSPIGRGACDREKMKKKATWIIGTLIVVIAASVVALRQKSILPASVMGEQFVPVLISDEAWRESIAKDPTADGYSGYGILQDRGSDAAIGEALRDLKSADAYVWLNAASYLGSRGRSEAIPYLIKALRHSAWRSDEERLAFLRKLTGQTFGNDFEMWRKWYEARPDRIEMDWKSSLGGAPRL